MQILPCDQVGCELAFYPLHSPDHISPPWPARLAPSHSLSLTPGFTVSTSDVWSLEQNLSTSGVGSPAAQWPANAMPVSLYWSIPSCPWVGHYLPGTSKRFSQRPGAPMPRVEASYWQLIAGRSAVSTKLGFLPDAILRSVNRYASYGLAMLARGLCSAMISPEFLGPCPGDV